jgi:hypothetical protein
VCVNHAFVRDPGHFVFVRTNTEMIAHKPSRRMAPDQKKKNPHTILLRKRKNVTPKAFMRKRKNVTPKAFLRLTPQKRPQIPNTA